MYRIGVDLGGTNIVAGVVNENNKIVAKGQRKTNVPRPAEKIFDDIAAAIEDAMTGKYDRIVVVLYTDWNAVNGEFCNFGEGFDYDAIFFPANVRVTLNMNGHKINRGMTTWEYNGEVMCVNNNADVIINDGTITGGWSSNGAGGIHIHDGAKVTLNNVNVVGNKADDDDGAGIAVYDGATLIMNGGSLKNNIVIDGSADRSYGVHVAKLAGLPDVVIKRAEQVLKQLEHDNQRKNIKNIDTDLPLFSFVQKEDEQKLSAVEETLAKINPDDLTAREALQTLYDLKDLFEKGK